MRVAAFAVLLVCGAWLLGTPAGAQTAAPTAEVSAYAWAGACKDCHKEIHEAWLETKHARAIHRLSGSERKQACVECHVTGAKALVDDKGVSEANAGVQCEACHGAGAAHVADPAVRVGLVKKPAAAVCENCHNARSPKFKGFFYDGMAALAHRTK